MSNAVQAKNKPRMRFGAKWVEAGQISEKSETRGKSREVLLARSMFDLKELKMKEGILMFTKATNWSRTGGVWRICLQSQWC